MDAPPSHPALDVAVAATTLRQRVRAILALALPIIGGMASQNVLNLVDTAMVGQLGSPALGAVGFGGMVHWLVGSFFLGMGSGVQAIAARRVGEQKPEGAVAAVHGALLVVACLVIPYALLLSTQTEWVYDLLSDDKRVIALGAPYLKVRMYAMCFVVANYSFRGYWNGIGRSTVYLRTIVVIHAVNIFLNWVLIFGNLGFPELGVTGAGIASAIAVGVGTLTYCALAYRYSREHGFLRRGATPKGTVGGVLRLSVPAGLQNVFLSAGFVALFRVAQLLGTRELAAVNVLINLSLTCLLPAMGFGLASATFVGQALGRSSPAEAKRWGWTTMALGCGTLLVLGIVLAAPARLWLDLLMKDARAVEIAIAPLILLGIAQPIDAVGIVLSQALIGAGYIRVVTIWSIALQWLLFLPAAYVIGVRMDGGLFRVWICLAVYRGIFSAVMALTFYRGRWVKTRV